MFDFKNELNAISASWRSFCLGRDRTNIKRGFYIYGPKGCGKTEIVREYVRVHSFAVYLSFEGLSDNQALKEFQKQFAPEYGASNNWDEAAAAFIKKTE